MNDDTSNLERLRVLADAIIGPELYVRLIEALPDALVVVDSNGLIVLFNARAEFLLGYHRSEVLGQSVDILVPDDARARHSEHRRGFMSDPRVRSMALNLPLAARHKDGHTFPVAINLSPVVAPEGLFVSAVIRARAGSQ